MNLTGKGIGVAILDSGIFPHIDFGNRIIAFYDVINHRSRMYDDNGHGTHIAGVLAGSGKASGGRYRGVAPEAGLISVKILTARGVGNSVDAIEGIRWISSVREKYGIRIVNISIGSTQQQEESVELIAAVEELWDCGIVVLAAAGNNGPAAGSVTAPGNSKKIITVGSYDEMLVRERAGRMRKYYSGQGPTKDCIMKPEIVARGGNVMGCKNNYNGYQMKSGTSMAVPYVSGMVARLLQKYPDMTPKDVKLRLHTRAVDLGLPKSLQGWGTIDESLF